MSASRWSFIPDLLEEHIDELAFLWGQRQRALRSQDVTAMRFRELEERIQGRMDGIRAVGPDAKPLLDQKLGSDDRFDVFAAAFGLLDQAVARDPAPIVEAFKAADGPRLDGLAMALSHSGAEVRQQLDPLLKSSNHAVAVAAINVSVFRSWDRIDAADIVPFLRHELPIVRHAAWRVVANAVVAVRPELFAAALRDDDAAIRAAAIEAAGWCGIQGVLTLARQVAVKAPVKHPEALEMLAILGGQEDLPQILQIGRLEELGALRYRVLGSYGAPQVISLLIEGMQDSDPKIAQAAGRAFTKMTGANIDSSNVVEVPPESEDANDPVTAEFGEPVTLPDPEAARREYQRMAGQWRNAGRLATGKDVATGLDAGTFASLDMQSRFECGLRGRFFGRWTGTAIHLESFPQPL